MIITVIHDGDGYEDDNNHYMIIITNPAKDITDSGNDINVNITNTKQKR